MGKKAAFASFTTVRRGFNPRGRGNIAKRWLTDHFPEFHTRVRKGENFATVLKIGRLANPQERKGFTSSTFRSTTYPTFSTLNFLNVKFFKNSFYLLTLALLSVSIVSCDDDEMPTPEPEPQNIVDIVVGDDDRFSTLEAALTQAGLVATLQGNGPFTVFAPTNEAFEAAGIDLDNISDEALSQVLLYHVLGARVAVGDLMEGRTYVTTAATNDDGDQLSLLVAKDGSSVTLNGDTQVTTADVEATNGVIHIIDQVLMPPTVVDLALDNEATFSELTGALQAADGDLVTVLSGDGPFTVFAPTNAAFEAAAAVTAGLSTAQLAEVLTYHVVAGNIRSEDLTATSVATVNGEEITIDPSGPTITDARGNVVSIVLTDVQGTNGVVHVIDAVLLPEEL